MPRVLAPGFNPRDGTGAKNLLKLFSTVWNKLIQIVRHDSTFWQRVVGCEVKVSTVL